MKNERTEVSDVDAPLQKLVVLQTELVTVRNKVANLIPAAICATTRDEPVRFDLKLTLVDAAFLKKR